VVGQEEIGEGFLDGQVVKVHDVGVVVVVGLLVEVEVVARGGLELHRG
jgi:hypothetical protein